MATIIVNGINPFPLKLMLRVCKGQNVTFSYLFCPRYVAYRVKKFNLTSGLVSQGSKLKKSSGCLLATNRTNIAARCKFLVAILCNVNDTAHYLSGLLIFSAVEELQNSGKSHEIYKNMKNTAKFARNLIKYMSIQHI